MNLDGEKILPEINDGFWILTRDNIIARLNGESAVINIKTGKTIIEFGTSDWVSIDEELIVAYNENGPHNYFDEYGRKLNLKEVVENITCASENRYICIMKSMG